MTVTAGKVYLVGAGPGDPQLITLRGVECLRRADVVLYDYLVNRRILQHARPSADLICLGRHGHGRIMPQDEINERMVSQARLGRTVVRLKGGDPAVFAHAAEEIEALTCAGVELEIVPGITAALAAGSYAGIPITHRDLSSAVALVTGQEDDAKGELLDYGTLATFPGTLVFYMGVTTAPAWSRALVGAGKSSATPVAIVRRCSWPDQSVTRCTLGEIPQVLAPGKMRPPAIVIVGSVAQLPSTVDWFVRRPLFGRTVLVTRPREQADTFVDRLFELGADVLVQPAIEISEPGDWAPVDAAIENLAEYDWLVFSSANGVRCFFERLLKGGRDVRTVGHVKLAAIGPATAEELADYRLHADVQPAEYRAEALAAALVGRATDGQSSDSASASETGAAVAGASGKDTQHSQPLSGQRFLLARASRGREVLAEMLTAAGAAVEQVVVYRSSDAPSVDDDVAAALEAGRIDWMTVTSSAIARSLVRLFGERLRKTKLVSISPLTSATLTELGHPPSAEARQYTTDGVIAAMLPDEPPR